MFTEEQKRRFNQMMEESAHLNDPIEKIAGQPDPQAAELTYAEHLLAKEKREKNIDEINAEFNEASTSSKTYKIPEKINEELKILECVLDSQEYLGYLKGMSISLKLQNQPYLGGFYSSRYDKFVMENTP